MPHLDTSASKARLTPMAETSDAKSGGAPVKPEPTAGKTTGATAGFTGAPVKPAPIVISEKLVSAAADIATRRDADGPMQDAALEIVRAFIIERGLVLYGGLAIDYALRARKAPPIYSDVQRPDFDFFSPNHVEDAYDLADRLHKQGFREVGAIRAIHVQTMRVKSDFIFVADISYMPPELFKKLPTLALRPDGAAVDDAEVPAGTSDSKFRTLLRIVHPDYQRMDMHLSLSYPFDNPPRENVFNRWAKDVKRFNLLAAAYPIDPNNLAAAKIGGAADAKAGPVVRAPFVPGAALHGFAAFAALRTAYAALEGGVGGESFRAPTIVIKNSEVEFAAPAEWPFLVVASCDPETDMKQLAGTPPAWYSAIMDSRPEMAVVGNVHVHAIRRRLLSVSVIEISGAPVTVVCVQALLLYFLAEAQYATTATARATAATYYGATLKMLAGATKLTAAAAAKIQDAAARDKYINSSPFMLTTRTMGDVNQDPAFRIRMAATVRDLQTDPPASLHLGTLAELKQGLEGLPGNYYPGKARPQNSAPFDYTKSPHFARAGGPIIRG